MTTAWELERAPESLALLQRQIKNAFGTQNVWIKGDEAHTYGYHRSAATIRAYGDPASDYSIKLDLDRNADANWLAAIDIAVPQPQVIEISKRLHRAMKDHDPRVAQLREYYGTLDGKSVSGWDAPSHSFASSDDSHLTHVHMSFYRSRAGVDHSGLLAVITGQEDDDMNSVQDFRLKLLFHNWAPTRSEWIAAGGDGAVYDLANRSGGAMNANAQAHTDTRGKLDALTQTVANMALELTRLSKALSDANDKLDNLAVSSGDPDAVAAAVAPAVSADLAKRLAS